MEAKASKHASKREHACARVRVCVWGGGGCAAEAGLAERARADDEGPRQLGRDAAGGHGEERLVDLVDLHLRAGEELTAR